MAVSDALNRGCLISLAEDILDATLANGGRLAGGHHLEAEYRGLTQPCRDRVDFYIEGANRRAEIDAARAASPEAVLSGEALRTALEEILAPSALVAGWMRQAAPRLGRWPLSPMTALGALLTLAVALAIIVGGLR